MKDISFDNPWLLLVAIPAFILILVPFFVIGNKDNKSLSWKISIGLHFVIVVLVTLAIAGLKATSVLTKTTVYVVADVSYSSERNFDEIDGYVQEIKENLPVNSSMGVVCFGRDVILLTPAGRTVKSVAEAKVDETATDIVGALNYTETLFKDDEIKRIVLITDGNDTVTTSVGAIASTVNRLTENGIKIDTIFLDNNIQEGEDEVQINGVEYTGSTYLGHATHVDILVQSSSENNVMVELYMREKATDDQAEAEFDKIDYTVLTLNEGINTVKMDLLSTTSGTFEYMVKVVADKDISEHNNSWTFTQEIVGRTKILLITGDQKDESLIELMYGSEAEIDSYIVKDSGANGQGTVVPFMLEEIIEYDEIVVSNVDIRDIRHVNAFIDSLDMAISQYGKSLITFGDLRLQTDAEDMTFAKFKELLPVTYGNSNREGRLYTIVLDVSHSMFYSSKFTTAKQSAIRLLSILGDDDYVCLVTFSGEVNVKTPRKASVCREELIEYINGLSTEHGTDIGWGLEEALKKVKELKLEENQIMLISDGFSFESTKDAVQIATELYQYGATISAIWTVGAGESGGDAILKQIVKPYSEATGGRYYKITKPEDVEGIIFGSVADHIGKVIVTENAKVNIVRYNEGIVKGFGADGIQIPMVSGYIISIEKYDAIVPLTVTHQRSNGYTESMPLYAYRSHGNGRVSSFTSNLSSNWTGNWTTEVKKLFVNNMFLSNTPKERHDAPFTVNIERTDQDAYIEIVPSILNPDAETTLKITLPDGRKITRALSFDSQKYFYTLETIGEGVYTIDITYKYDDKTFKVSESFNIAYLAEYNEFVGCDTSKIYEFMRGKGTINEGSIPDLENDKKEVSTYQESYEIPLLIAAIVVFVVDILIRKLALGKKKGVAKAQKK